MCPADDAICEGVTYYQAGKNQGGKGERLLHKKKTAPQGYGNPNLSAKTNLQKSTP